MEDWLTFYPWTGRVRGRTPRDSRRRDSFRRSARSVASSKAPGRARAMFRTVAAALARRSARHVVDATERRFSRFDALRRCQPPTRSRRRRAGMCHDARALGPLPGDAEHAVSDVDKFLFDTNGFVVVKDVFSKDDLRAFHDAIDAHAHLIHERKGQLRLTAAKTPLSGDGKTGRKDLAGFLGWQKPHCDPFRSVLAHPKLVPYLHELVGRVTDWTTTRC